MNNDLTVEDSVFHHLLTSCPDPEMGVNWNQLTPKALTYPSSGGWIQWDM